MEKSALGTYDRIDEATFKDGSKTFLLVDSNNENSFEVDMKSDFFFNELEIESRNTIQSVSTLSEVLQFCKENDITFGSCNENRLRDNVLYVGGEADMIVNDMLEYDWENE